MKIVVFDLDETLGYFTQLGILWDCLKDCASQKEIELSQNDFNNLLDQNQEFLRPDIIKILSYLKKKKKSKTCNKIMIYTNNTGNRDWCEKIIEYFHFKLNYNLFDQIIAAFKIDGKIIELGRTTYDKTYKDLLRCTKIPNNSDICFLDDKYHPLMMNNQIYYIQLKPYYCDINWDTIINRLQYCNLPDCLSEHNMCMMVANEIKSYRYTPKFKEIVDLEMDKDISKDIYKHLVIFFNDRKTKKNKKNTNNKTSRLF